MLVLIAPLLSELHSTFSIPVAAGIPLFYLKQHVQMEALAEIKIKIILGLSPFLEEETKGQGNSP